MLQRWVDRADALIERHRMAASILASAYFWFGVGIQANFIDLPPIPYVSEKMVFWTGIALGTIWWAVLYPRIMQRRKDREAGGIG